MTPRLVSVSQHADGHRFTIIARYATAHGGDLVRSLSGQQVMNVLAVALGEPTEVMVNALATYLTADGSAYDADRARDLLKAALAPTACTWGPGP